MAKCRILKRFGNLFVENVGNARSVIGRKNFKLQFIGEFSLYFSLLVEMKSEVQALHKRVAA